MKKLIENWKRNHNKLNYPLNTNFTKIKTIVIN